MASEPTTGFVPQLAGEAIAVVPELDAEKAVLLAWYGQQRGHALAILDGLDEAALRRPVLPSGWSCLGMIQHLAGMERFWFRAVVAGDPAVIAGQAGAEEEWRVAPDVPVAAVLDEYRQESARADAIILATPLGAAPAWWPEGLFGDWRLQTVREIVLHTLSETACHAGHLDAVRELIDGRLWLVLTE